MEVARGRAGRTMRKLTKSLLRMRQHSTGDSRNIMTFSMTKPNDTISKCRYSMYFCFRQKPKFITTISMNVILVNDTTKHGVNTSM